MARDIDTRAVTLVDLPLIRRLGSKATVLNSAIEYTQVLYEPNTTTLTSMILPHHSLHTLVARSDKQQVVGQFRLKTNEQNAHIVYIAPGLEDDCEDTTWLHMLDAMAREAGQRSAHALIAEVREDSLLFETMRTAGFAVYARQQVWRRDAEETVPGSTNINIVAETDNDAISIQSLIAHVVPPIMQPFITPDEDMDGWVMHRDGKVMAYIGMMTGKQGIFLRPFIHTDVLEDATDIFSSLICQLPKTDKLPMYVCISRFQDWIATPLERLNFEPGPRQAVMVKHITAGVRQATFKPVKAGNKVIAGPVNPPNSQLRWREPDLIVEEVV